MVQTLVSNIEFQQIPQVQWKIPGCPKKRRNLDRNSEFPGKECHIIKNLFIANLTKTFPSWLRSTTLVNFRVSWKGAVTTSNYDYVFQNKCFKKTDYQCIPFSFGSTESSDFNFDIFTHFRVNQIRKKFVGIGAWTSELLILNLVTAPFRQTRF